MLCEGGCCVAGGAVRWPGVDLCEGGGAVWQGAVLCEVSWGGPVRCLPAGLHAVQAL